MNKLVIHNARIITPTCVTDSSSILIEDGRIKVVQEGRMDLENAEYVDACGNYLSPGFIDLHTHGAGNADFMDNSIEACLTIASTHAKHGTTLLFPTTLTSTDKELFSFFETYKKVKTMEYNGAVFGGIHLEGPYFSYKYRGAQDPRFLKSPNPNDYDRIMEHADGNIACWSLAPELPGAIEFGKVLIKKGIRPSIGHTEATYDDVLEAYKAGIRSMTHFYSAMEGITRKNAMRYAGCIEAGYLLEDIDVEIIADGVHVPKPLLELVFKIKGAEHIALVTDSMRAAGMPEGESILGSLKNGQEVLVEDGVAKMLDRTAFAGSVATADRLIRTMVKIVGLSICQAVQMMTATPARIAKLDDKKGAIKPGYDADLVIFDDNIDVKASFVKGKNIYNNFK